MNGFMYYKRVEQYLHKAIEEDLFEVYYQPVYSTRERRFITVEALSRLYHRTGLDCTGCVYSDCRKESYD